MVALAPVAMFAFAWRESGAAVGFAGRLVRRSRRGRDWRPIAGKSLWQGGQKMVKIAYDPRNLGNFG